VIAPDLLGWGASDKPANLEEYSFERQAGRIKSLLQALGIERATFVVHDLGGPWTWEIAKRWPDLIERLVILNTTAYRDGITPPTAIKLVGGPIGPAMLAVMRSRIAGRTMIGDFIRQFVGHPERISREIVEGYWTSLNEGTQAFLQMARSFGDFYTRLPEWGSAVDRLTIPAMIIWGKRDPVLNAAKLTSQFSLSLRIPAERVHIFEDSGHYIQEDRPEDLARLVTEFVRD
jgi:haloalkane dehalogenase